MKTAGKRHNYTQPSFVLYAKFRSFRVDWYSISVYIYLLLTVERKKTKNLKTLFARQTFKQHPRSAVDVDCDFATHSIYCYLYISRAWLRRKIKRERNLSTRARFNSKEADEMRLLLKNAETRFVTRSLPPIRCHRER